MKTFLAFLKRSAAVGLAMVLAGCLGQPPQPQSQAEPQPQPTPEVRIEGAEVPPIDREGAVTELEVPANQPPQSPFEGASAQANTDQETLTPVPTPITESRIVLLPGDTPTPDSQEDDEPDLPKPLQALERTEEQPSRATAEFKDKIRQQVLKQARNKLEPNDPNAPPSIEIRERDMVLNFENIEIRDFILQLHDAGILPLNYILDANVQGSITIKTADPIAPEDLFDVILTILQANGLAIVKDGDYFRIVAAGDGKSFLIETYVTHNPRVVEDTNEEVTIIVPLEYMSTDQANGVLDQFKDKDTQIFAYQPGNLLFMTGYSARLKRMLQILELVDIGTSREELRVYQLFYTAAEDVKATIEQILGSGDLASRVVDSQATAGGRRRRRAAQPAADKGGGAGQPILIAEPRSNRLIAFASKRELEFIEKIINLLDQEVAVSDRLFIYPVENAEAGEMASTLLSLYGEEGGTGGGTSSGSPAAGVTGARPGGPRAQGADAKGNAGSARERLQQRRQQQGNGTGTRGGRRGTRGGNQAGQGGNLGNDVGGEDVGGAFLMGMDEAASDEAELLDVAQNDSNNPEPGTSELEQPASLKRQLSPRAPKNVLDEEYMNDLLLKDGSTLTNGSISIVADERTNMLIVKTAPANWPILKETIRKLDIQPKQVMLDVMIAEVTLDETNEFGIEWSVLSENTIGDSTFAGTTQTNFGVADKANGFSYTLLEATRFKGFLNAFANQNELEVLSRPHLLASNNEEATFDVGNEIPVVTQQFQNNTSGTPNTNGFFNSIQYRDTGILMNLTPRINAANFVALESDIEISEAQSNTVGGTDQPIIRKRSVQNSVVIPNGQTLLIGGILQSNRDTSKQNVPWVRRIPIIKHLFGSQKKSVRKTELFIAITPHVIQTPSDASEQSTGFRRQLSPQIDQLIKDNNQTRKWWEP